MKIKHINILILPILILITSCDRFLEEKSQDLYIPKTVQDLKELIAGEGLGLGSKKAASLSEFVDVMTDDVGENVNPRRKSGTDSRDRVWSYYTWQKDPEVMQDNQIFRDYSWETYYHRIVLSNMILSRADELPGTEVERNDAKGEAFFLRAFSYFMLINSYAKPYTTAKEAESEKGVPINSFTDVQKERNISPSSVKAVYDLIEEDINEAIQCFSKSKLEKSILRPGLEAALLLKSRVSLYTKKYEAVIASVDELLKVTDKHLFDIRKLDKNSRFIDKNNTEILFSYGEYYLSNYVAAGPTSKGSFVVSPDLYEKYAKDDARKKVFFSQYKPRIKPFKYYSLSSKQVKAYAFRLGEAYLNRAEAKFLLGDNAGAIKDIETLRASRIDGDPSIKINTNDELLEKIRLERRLELCFEGHRWFDLRRYGCPSISHTYSSSDNAANKTIFKLEVGDSRYTLPYPHAEIKNIHKPENHE